MHPALAVLILVVGPVSTIKNVPILPDKESPVVPTLSYKGDGGLLGVISGVQKRRFQEDSSACSTLNPKYFWECPTNGHLDRKFSAGKPPLSSEDIRKEVHGLLERLSTDAAKKGAKPILIAGCLIGNYFNGKPLPWDDDCDIAFFEDDFRKLTNWEDSDYEFRINPYWADRGPTNAATHDENNRIDCRLISKSNGHFMAIVALTKDLIDPEYVFQKGNNNPEFAMDWFLPLNEPVFDGISGLYAPHDMKPLLKAYYGSHVFKPRYHDWIFDEETKEWSRA